MDAVKYLKEKQRMCEKYIDCLDCPLDEVKSKHHITCVMTEKTHSEEAVEIVEKWSAENPEKTILQDFLEKYPNAKSGVIIRNTCPDDLGYEEEGNKCSTRRYKTECEECWNRPLEG